METGHKSAEPGLRRWQWMLANAVGWIVAALAVWGLSRCIVGVGVELAQIENLTVASRLVGVITVNAVGGGIIGFAQWLVLRRRMSRIGWWIAATALGCLLGLVAAVFTVWLMFEKSEDVTGWRAMAIVIAMLMLTRFLIGVTQWLVIRRYVHRAGWWVLASTVGLIIGIIVTSFTYFDEIGRTTHLIVQVVVEEGLEGLLYGAITGDVLIWLLERPVRRAVESVPEA